MVNPEETNAARQDRPEGVGLAERLRSAPEMSSAEWVPIWQAAGLTPGNAYGKLFAALAALGSQDRPAPDRQATALAFLAYIEPHELARQSATLRIDRQKLRALLESFLASRSAPDGWVLPAELRELSKKAPQGEWKLDEAWSVRAYDGKRTCFFGSFGCEEATRLAVAAVNFVRSLAASPSALDGEGDR